MTNTQLPPLAQDYLARLAAECRRLPADQAEELLSDLTAHVHEGLSDTASEAEVRTLLDRLGTPREVVDSAAGATEPPAATSPAELTRQPGGIEIGAVIVLIATGLTAPLVFLSIPAWIVGLVLLAVSQVWTGREKLRGLLSLGTGLPLVLAMAAASVVSIRVSDCGSHEPVVTPARPGSPEPVVVPPSDASCAADGPAWYLWVFLALVVAYFIYQFMTARRLLRKR